jgi:predicted  nucleic acid-binding Zn-ribbon protein
MKPAPAAPADPLNLLRQQIILAQVRIMELEDTRDELQPKLAATEKLLAGAQTLLDLKLGETAHLNGVVADLQAQVEHLRHMQHVTHEALAAARAENTAAARREQDLLAEQDRLKNLVLTHAEDVRRQLERLAATRAETETQRRRIAELDAERRGMQTSRSWRWTAWLRAIERTVNRRQK